MAVEDRDRDHGVELRQVEIGPVDHVRREVFGGLEALDLDVALALRVGQTCARLRCCRLPPPRPPGGACQDTLHPDSIELLDPCSPLAAEPDSRQVAGAQEERRRGVGLVDRLPCVFDDVGHLAVGGVDLRERSAATRPGRFGPSRRVLGGPPVGRSRRHALGRDLGPECLDIDRLGGIDQI